jgi:hypothetical protein
MEDSFMTPVGFDGCRNKFCQDCRNTYTYYCNTVALFQVIQKIFLIYNSNSVIFFLFM